MRLSTAMMYERSINSMLTQQAKAGESQLHISSGKRILSPSDDPAGSARLLDLNNTIAQVQQFQENGDRVVSRLELEDQTLDGVNNLLVRAHELAIQGNNGTLVQDQLEAVAAEVRQLLEQMTALANTKDANEDYIFAGYKTDTVPFENLGGGSYAYRGDDGQRNIQVSFDRQIADGDTGRNVFMGIQTSSGGTSNAFEILDGLATALESGTSPGVYIDDVQLVMDRVLSVRASVGARLNSMDEQTQVNENFLLNMETNRSNIEDVDLAKAISEYQRQLVALEASQKSYVQIQGLSLFNYL